MGAFDILEMVCGLSPCYDSIQAITLRRFLEVHRVVKSVDQRRLRVAIFEFMDQLSTVVPGQGFQRASLVDQVAGTLRGSLQKGQFPEVLPGERPLSDFLQVSRPVLRAALGVLRREGLLRISGGRWSQTVGHVKVKTAPSHKKTVVLLSAVQFHEMSPSHLLVIGELRRNLQNAGVHFEVHADSRYYHGRMIQSMEALVREKKVDLWLLHWVTVEAQKWFAAKGYPAIVFGTVHEGIGLPAFGRDYRAICRHAVGVCLGMGHRRIALVIRKSGLAGDIASEAGFREGFGKSRHAEATPIVFHHDGSMANVCSSILRCNPRPTALIVAVDLDCLSLMTRLTYQGFTFPKDFSLISRDDEPFMGSVFPSIARYQLNGMSFAKRLAREVIKRALSGASSARQIGVMAQFQQGDSMGPLQRKSTS